MATRSNQTLSFDEMYQLIWLTSDALWVKTSCPESSDYYPVTSNPA